MKKFLATALMALVLPFMASGTATASTITIYDNDVGAPSAIGTFDYTGADDAVKAWYCTLDSCTGTPTGSGNTAYIDYNSGDFSLENVMGTALMVQPDNERSEADSYASISGVDPSTAFTGQVKDESGANTFSFFGLVAAVKFGAGTVFLENMSGGAITLTWMGLPGVGSGLSHVTNFLPIPGAIWLLLSGLAGLGVMSRFRRS